MSSSAPSVLSNIFSQMDDFSASERRIAEFVLENQDAIIIKQADLAATTGTSPATISRFCKRVGMRNFREFQTVLYSDIMANHGGGITAKRQEVSMGDVPGSIAYILANKLEDTEAMVNSIPEGTIEAIVEAIQGARRVFVAGIGKTIPCAIDAAYKLSLLGIPAETSEIYEKMLASAVSMGAGDVILFFSASGYCPRLLRVAAAARDRGVTIIVITGNSDSPMAHVADLLIYTTSREKAINSSFGYSLTHYIFITEIIYLLLATETACAANLDENSRYQIGKGLAMGD